MEWMNRIVRQYSQQVAHAFILHGNVNDYVAPGHKLYGYLSQAFAGREFIEYSPAAGIRFRTPEARKRVMALVGGEPASADDGMFAALGIASQPEKTDDTSSTVFANQGDSIDLLYKIGVAAVDDGREFLRPVILIRDGDMIVPPGAKATMQPADRQVLAKLRGWGGDASLDNAGPTILITTAMISEIHPDIVAASSKWESIEIPMPTAEDRLALIERTLSSDSGAFSLEDGLTADRVANLTAGLSLVHVEDVILAARSAGKLTTEMIVERKRDIMQSEFAGVLSSDDNLPDFSLVGGHAIAKERFALRVVKPMLDGSLARATTGVLLTGPSGTGKTLLAKAVAGEAGLNFVELRIGGQIASKWQGEGERNLRRALDAVMAFAPTIVLIDEVDQVVSRGNGSNQQDSRMFQMLLSFISDPKIRGKVVLVCTTNRPDIIDPALMRRMEDVIPVLPPNAEDRREVIKILAREFIVGEIGDDDVTPEMIEMCEGWTQDDIKKLVRKADLLMYGDASLSVRDAIIKAFASVTSTTRDIQFMTSLAIQNCNDDDLLPVEHRQRAKIREAMEEVVDDQPRERRGRRG